LKAKYYPHGDIRDTVFASDPSPVWKGVEFGLELLKEGLISRIGNGKSTQIMRDQWIPRAEGLKITALKKNTRCRWINQLIDQESKTWKSEAIHDIFFDHDTEAIQKIEIPPSDIDDRIA
jgi:hypothetical protein